MYVCVVVLVWLMCMLNWRVREYENMCIIMDINKYYFIKKNCFGNELSMINYLRIIVIYFWVYIIISIYFVVLRVDGFFVFFKCS